MTTEKQKQNHKPLAKTPSYATLLVLVPDTPLTPKNDGL